MRLSIGACLYGFAVGGSLFFIQVLAVGVFHHLKKEPAMGLLEMTPYLIIGLIGYLFLLACAFWLICLLVVFPVSFLFRAFPIPLPLAGGIGGLIAGVLCWLILKSPGFGSGVEALHFSLITSAIVTGSVTGFMLARLQIEKIAPDKTSSAMGS